MKQAVSLLALCGSLRARSVSAGLLRAFRAHASADVEVRIFEDMGRLPLFNPDLEPHAPMEVHALWDEVAKTDALLIVSPEYAHGVTGTIKNALDWLVGQASFVFKPVAVINPSLDAQYADSALKETLRTMSAELIPDACMRIPVIGAHVDPDEIAAHAGFLAEIRAVLDAIVSHVRHTANSTRAIP